MTSIPEAPDEISGKVCSKCGMWKPREDFNRDKRLKSGMTAKCKQCTSEYNSQFYSKNRDSKLRYRAEYYWANRENLLGYWSEYARKNPDKRRASHKRRRARLAGVANDNHTDAQVWELYGTDCYLCGVQVVEDGKRLPNYHEEHVVPISLGGDNTLVNVRPSCSFCNTKKLATPLIVYLWRRTQDQLRSGELVITDSDHDWYAEHCREIEPLNT